VGKQKEVWDRHSNDLLETFLEPLHVQYRLTQAAKATLARYYHRRWMYNSAFSEFTAAKVTNDTAKASGVVDASTVKKEEVFERAKQTMTIARRSYEDFSEKMIAEIDNFRTQRSIEMRKLFHQFITLEV
jgi:hypothetical protein